MATARHYAVAPGVSGRPTSGQPSRTYSSITDARSDGNNARVWGGMHYPSTVEISDALGEAIAKYVNGHSMKRLHRQQR